MGSGREPSKGPELGARLAEGHAQACRLERRLRSAGEAPSWGSRLPLGLWFGCAVQCGANIRASPDSVSSPVICGKRGFHTQVVRVQLNGKSVREPRCHPRGGGE